MNKIYSFLLAQARKTGISRLKTIRKIHDFFKGHLRSNAVPFVINIQGFRIKGLSWLDYLSGAYEPETTALFKKTIKSGWTIIDVGADMGYYSLLSAKLTGPEGQVFAFEPYSFPYKEHLLKNIALNNFKNIVPVKKAADEKNIKREFFVNSRSFYDVKRNFSGSSDEIEKIECVTLDEFFKDYKRPINLVKIDVEGAEIKVLKGMSGILKKNKDIKLIIEIFPQGLAAAGSSPEEVVSLLKSHGLKFYWINDDGTVAGILESEIFSRLKTKKNINIFCKQR